MTTYNDQFIRMPMRILSISHINGIKFSDNSKTLYCYLKGFDKAFPSYSKIGEVFGISARAAEERVKKLVELGLVIKTRRFSSSNLYEVLEIPGQEEPNEVEQAPDIPETVDSFFFDDDTEEDTPVDNFEDVQPSPPPKTQAISPFDFKSPRDERFDGIAFERLNDASDRFLVFQDYDLPYLVLFESQGKLTNPAAIEHLKMKRNLFERTGRL